MPQDAARKISTKYGRFLFSAYGCVLTERRTATGGYVYTAINYETGKSEILSRRKREGGAIEIMDGEKVAQRCELLDKNRMRVSFPRAAQALEPRDFRRIPEPPDGIPAE